MEIILKGSPLIIKNQIDTGRFTKEYFENRISPRLLSGFKILGIENLFFKQQAIVPYNSKTLINWYNREKVAETDIDKYLLFPIGSTTSKGHRIKEILLLENKSKLVSERKEVINDRYNEELEERLGLVNCEEENKTYGEFKILSYPRRRNDTIYTLYFDFEKYKDRFKENRESWVIPIAEVASDTIDNDFKGVYNAVYILVNIYELFFIDEELATVLLNNIIGWYLLSLRGVKVEDLKKTYNEELEKIMVSLSERNFDSEIDSKKTSIERNESEIKTYQRRLEGIRDKIQFLILNKDKLEGELKELQEQAASGNVVDENIKFQLEEIMKLKNVKKVEFDEQYRDLYVFTKMLYIKVGKFTYRIGEFKIKLHCLNKTQLQKGFGIREPRFINLTPGCRRLSYWGKKCHHPHVSESGDPCLGNGRAIYDCLRESDIFGATVLALEYLQSVNTSDPAGRHITSWDIVDEEDNVIQLGYKYDNPPANMRVNTCQKCGTEAVASSGEVIEYTLDNGEQLTLCKDCIGREPHLCPTCHSVFLGKTSNGSKNNRMKQCRQCGEYFCDSYCFEEDSLSTSEEEAYSTKKNICIKCARKEINEIKRKEVERRLKIAETLDLFKSANQKSTEDLRELFIKRRSKSLEKYSLETEDKCPCCDKDWEEHYHCIDCGMPVCNPKDTENPRCDFCNEIQSDTVVNEMAVNQYQIEQIIEEKVPISIENQPTKICSVCGEPMPIDEKGDECQFCKRIDEEKKTFLNTRFYTWNFSISR